MENTINNINILPEEFSIETIEAVRNKNPLLRKAIDEMLAKNIIKKQSTNQINMGI